jgi:hypothetical protein
MLSTFSMLSMVPQVSYWQNYAGHKLDLIFERGDYSFAMMLMKPKDPRRVHSTIEKFAETTKKSTVVIFIPYLDAVGMNIAYKVEQLADIAGKEIITVEIPLQFLG